MRALEGPPTSVHNLKTPAAINCCDKTTKTFGSNKRMDHQANYASISIEHRHNLSLKYFLYVSSCVCWERGVLEVNHWNPDYVG